MLVALNAKKMVMDQVNDNFSSPSNTSSIFDFIDFYMVPEPTRLSSSILLFFIFYFFLLL